MNKQEMMMEVQEMAQQAEQIEQHCQFLDQQINDLEKFRLNLLKFDAKQGNKMLSGFGKGVFVETELKSENMLVEVGAGILVRKKPEEVREILGQQIKALTQSRIYFAEQFEKYAVELQRRMSTIEGEAGKDGQ